MDLLLFTGLSMENMSPVLGISVLWEMPDFDLWAKLVLVSEEFCCSIMMVRMSFEGVIKLLMLASPQLAGSLRYIWEFGVDKLSAARVSLLIFMRIAMLIGFPLNTFLL